MFLIFSLLAFGLSGAVIAAAQAVAGVLVGLMLNHPSSNS